MSNHGKKKIMLVPFIVFISLTFVMPSSALVINPFTTASINSHRIVTSTTLYVDDDNIVGPWDGSLEHPYRYIQEAIDHAADGYTVYVFAGSYAEHLTVFYSISLLGENKLTTTITGGREGTVVKITAPAVTLTGFTITKSGIESTYAGVSLNSQHNTIVGNIILRNYYGIYATDSENLLYHNNIIGNTYQAYDESMNDWDHGSHCGGNYWSDYVGVDDNEDGIGEASYDIPGYGNTDRYPLVHPYGSVMNSDTQEIFLTIQQAINDPDTSCGHIIMVKNGRYDEHLSIFKGVTIQGEDTDDTIVDGSGWCTVVSICAHHAVLAMMTIQQSGSEEYNAGILITGNANTITQTRIQNNFQGLVLTQGAEENTIANNIIRDNAWNGISLKCNSKGNHLTENTIMNNGYAGLYVTESSYNSLYHNTIEDNTHTAYDDSDNLWDDGYPSGGNHWDDYQGVDENQDGIGDTAYSIPDGIGTDRYPLMEPYTDEDVVPPDVSILSPQNGLYIKNLQLFSKVLKQKTIILGDPTILIQASDARSGIQKVEIYIDDHVTPKATLYQPPYQWTWTERSLIKHQHVIIVVAYDNAGNAEADMTVVKKFF